MGLKIYSTSVNQPCFYISFKMYGLILFYYRPFSFEKSYCLYRLNRPEEALQIINEETELGDNFKELKAQILYKLEKYVFKFFYQNCHF